MSDCNKNDKFNTTINKIFNNILFSKKLWVFLVCSFCITSYAIYFEELDTIQRRVTAPLIVFMFMIGILTFVLPSE